MGLITEDPGAISRLRDLTSDDIYSTIAELDVYFHDVAEKNARWVSPGALCRHRRSHGADL